MACNYPTGTNNPGILIAYDPTDTGDRPIASNIAFWASPNVRLAPQSEISDLRIPANWDTPQYANWNGQVNENSAYNLLVRVRNTDPSQPRADLQLQGWISYPTASGVGPLSEVLEDPNMPAGPLNPPVTFTGFNAGPLATANAANPNDPASMLVMESNEQWTPNPNQYSYHGYNGHVCAVVNVYGFATSGEMSTPDGQQFVVGNYVDPTCDRMYGQRNVQIVQVQQGQRIQIPILLFVPVTDRCPLHAAVAIRPVELKEGQGGVLLDVPELARAASDQAIAQLNRPEGDPLQHVRIGPDGSDDSDHDWDRFWHHDRDRLKVSLEPGERTDIKVNLDARNQRPGDAYALDLITTDTATGQLFGAARILVLVTD
jgi:hypothetical protein